MKSSIILTTISILVLGACQTKPQTAEEPEMTLADLESQFEGAAKQYQMLCASCHGQKIGAFVDRNWKDGYNTEYLINRISVGDEEDGMPAFADAMTEEEMTEMSEYIKLSIENRSVYDFEEDFNVKDTFNTEQFSFRLEAIAEGLEIPWGMAFLPDGDILIADRNGKMFRRSYLGMKEIINIPAVLYKGQGGLMDVELHPDYEENHFIYFSYSKFKKEADKTMATTAVVRAKLIENSLENSEEIFEALPYFTTSHHYGSRLEFDNDGYLYISIGERGKRDLNPQALDNHCGKIHRINDDGSIPVDNPFVGKPDAIPSIYSYGHRNPQGVIKHPKTGEIWTHEHGPRGGDEINIIKKGSNYGWPEISYGINYNGTIFTSETEKEGMEPPLHYWVPSIAPCGMDFVRGNMYPGWEGNLLIGSLRFRYLHMCLVEDNKVISEELLLKNIGRLRNVKQGPDGYIYIGVEDPGRIYKLIPIH